MTTDKSKSLWEQDFRLVTEGLAETDVVIFVERLMREHRQRVEQLDHIESLHELAKKTVEDAEKIAASTRQEGRADAHAEAERIVAEAHRKATEIIEDGDRAANERAEAARAAIAALETEFHAKGLRRSARLDSAFQALVESAKQELSTRMPRHYVGKHLYQSVNFIPAFEKLIREVEDEISVAGEVVDPAPNGANDQDAIESNGVDAASLADTVTEVEDTDLGATDPPPTDS